MTPVLEVDDVRHAYDGQSVLHGVSFELQRGTIGCLLGPSGCGKTTLLRCIAGFERVLAGEIRLNGSVVSSARYTLPPESRRIGIVFQDYALFPHLTVARNVAFGLHGLDAGARSARVADLLAITGLSGHADHYPHELSGGQQQRVALARALAPRPELLLLDEPFSNLDVDLRERLSIEVRDILKELRLTAILVTHDQNEAFNIADEVGVISNGSIVQWATPYNLYHQPTNRFVADFVGQGVFLPGTILGPDGVELEFGVVRATNVAQWPPGTAVDILVRPDDVLHDDSSTLQARVVHKAFRGAQFLYTLQTPGGKRLMSFVPSHHDHAVGENIGIRLELDHVVAFKRDSA
ncbi:MAG: ABC transporter ATP-binding protein [Rhodospirillaceae bacterium]